MLRDSTRSSPTSTVESNPERLPERPRSIRCPRCGWSPDRTARWACDCLHAWNTFETAGACPACGKRWLETQCLECGHWSKHRN